MKIKLVVQVLSASVVRQLDIEGFADSAATFPTTCACDNTEEGLVNPRQPCFPYDRACLDWF